MKMWWMLPVAIVVMLFLLIGIPYLFSEYVLNHFIQSEGVRGLLSIGGWFLFLLGLVGFIIDKHEEHNE